MKILGVIPARYASTRLPGKVLLDICGKPMIQRVFERAARAACLNELVIATDDEKVFQAVNDSGALGVYAAIKAMGKNTSDFYIGGADATAEALSKMKEKGSVYRSTIDIDPYGTGKKCVDVMLDYVRTGVKNETFYFDMKPIWQQ